MQTPAQLRQEIRRVKAEIEATVQSAQPRGMWESFMGADAQRVEDAEAKVLQLKAESCVLGLQKAAVELAHGALAAAFAQTECLRRPLEGLRGPVDHQGTGRFGLGFILTAGQQETKEDG